MLELHGLYKNFEDNDVLIGLDLTVNSGDCIAIMGASGCGKTTLLRLIAGLDTLTKGKVLYNGKVIKDLSSKEKWPDITLVFQEINLLPHLTCFDNCLFGTNSDAVGERIYQYSEILGVQHCLSRRPNRISRGEAQRVAIIRSLVRGSSLLLLDEPTSALDAKTREKLASLLLEEMRREEISIVCVTHDINFAKSIGAKSYLLDGGQLSDISFESTKPHVLDLPRGM